MTFDSDYPKTYGLPNFKMVDEVTYMTPDGKKRNVWSEPPVYLPSGIASIEQFKNTPRDQYNKIKILGPEIVDADIVFSTKVEVQKNCTECIVVLKHTYHPGWRAYIDGKRAKTMIVFPFYTAIHVPEGVHDIRFSYEPSKLKIFLFVLALLSVGACFWLWRQYALNKFKA